MSSPLDALVSAMDATLIVAMGETVTHAPSGAPSYQLKGILRTGIQLESLAPGTYASVFFRISDLATYPRANDTFTARGSAFRVVDVNADSPVSVRVSLQRLEPISD